jgi:hypothetical protein
MKPNKKVLEAMRRYDRKLYVKWNNVDHVWEVWRKMPWNDMMVTPIVPNIFEVGQGEGFVPFDYRIVEWLYSADSRRKDLPMAWKWKTKRAFLNNDSKTKSKFKSKLQQAAQDNYYLINNELISPHVEDTGWKAPDSQSTYKNRIMKRSEYYQYDSN